jgi:hypothetical protein
MAIAIGAGIAAAGTLASSAMSGSAAQSAANTQAGTEQQAAQLQYQEFEQQQQNLAPYLAEGKIGLSDLNSQLGSLTSAFTPGDLTQYPGYQFQLQQGDLATQDQNASRGLLNSGATLRDISTYNQGLASTTYNNAFNQYQTQQTNTFNKLATVAGLGQAATQQANSASQNYANQAGSAIVGAGNAQAAGQIGVANAYNSGISGITSNLGQYLTLNQLMGNSSSMPAISQSSYMPDLTQDIQPTAISLGS